VATHRSACARLSADPGAFRAILRAVDDASRRPVAALTIAIALALPLDGRADWSADARLTGGAGADSNARRDYQQLGTQSDAMALLIGAGQLHWRGERGEADGSYELGLRKFLQLSSEDVLVQSGAAQGTWLLSRNWALGAEGYAKDRRGGERDYTDLTGSAFVQFAPEAPLDLRLRAGVHRFLYPPNFPYSFRAGELGFQGRYRFDRHHSVSVIGELGLRLYNSDARIDPRVDPPAPEQRQDLAFVAGAGYSYRGPIAFSAAYSYAQASSNSFGESLYRHRFNVSAALRLPFELTLLGQAALQITRYPDGPYPTPEIILIEDDNHDSLSFKLLRPVSKHVDLELHYSLYHDAITALPENPLTYLRQVAWMGFTWRL